MSGALGHMSGRPTAISEVRTRVGDTDDPGPVRVQSTEAREEPEEGEGEIEEGDQELRRR
jgi:hypothetical protein